MKLKTSFCNWTVLKKDITRFLPVWAIYLIGGLLVCSATIGDSLLPDTLHDILSTGMPGITCGYAIVVALLLFGDLFNGRMCNALHAMPLRRETWFCTHLISGITMALVPNFVLALILMPSLGSLWYVALLWVGGSMLMYLFFFGAACLCCLSTGNKFAAILVYALINLFSMELLWLTESLIMPFLYGVRLHTTVFYYLCPVAQLTGADYFTITNLGESYYSGKYVFGGFESGWLYLFILATIGIAMAVAALVLYRKRHLEVAGDFAAIAPVRWAISILGSLLCGMVFRLFALYTNSQYILLFIGMTVGFFLLQMLLQRSVKIFRKSVFFKCGILLLSALLILVLAAVDILGFETYIPKAEEIDSVVVANTILYDDQLERIDQLNDRYYNYAVVSNSEQIQTVLQAHEQAISEKADTNVTYVTLHYRLKNGRTVTRVYKIGRSKNTYRALAPFWGDMVKFPTHFDSIYDMMDHLGDIMVDGEVVSAEYRQELLQHLWNDAVNCSTRNESSSELEKTYTVAISYVYNHRAVNEKFVVDEECSTYYYIENSDASLFE